MLLGRITLGNTDWVDFFFFLFRFSKKGLTPIPNNPQKNTKILLPFFHRGVTPTYWTPFEQKKFFHPFLLTRWVAFYYFCAFFLQSLFKGLNTWVGGVMAEPPRHHHPESQLHYYNCFFTTLNTLTTSTTLLILSLFFLL